MVIPRTIRDPVDLQRCVASADVCPRECVSYELTSQKSRLQKEYVHVSIRKQAQVFLLGDHLTAADIDGRPGWIQIRLADLNSQNAQIRRCLLHDPTHQIRILRMFLESYQHVERCAAGFAAKVSRGVVSDKEFLEYLDASTTVQELGTLQYAISRKAIHARIEELVGRDSRLIDAVLTPTGSSAFHRLHIEELRLAKARIEMDDDAFRRNLERCAPTFRLLSGEDLDCLGRYNEDSLQRRIDKIVRFYGGNVDCLDRQIARATGLADAKTRSRQRAQDALALRLEDAQGSRILVLNCVALNDHMADHEDNNRRQRMRFLEQTQELMAQSGLDAARHGLLDLVCSLA